MSYNGPAFLRGDVSRPPLRYFGGKFLAAHRIVSEFPPHRCYVEPFGGGAGVLLRKPRSHSEVYNDLDSMIVNLFRVLRNPRRASALKRRLEFTPFSRFDFEQTFNDNWPSCDIERAAWTIIRSQMGFGSSALNLSRTTGFRANGIRNNSSPPIDWMRLPDHLESITERLRGVAIECREYRKILGTYTNPETLFYLDPPYPESTRSSDHGYNHELKTEDEHGELLDLVVRNCSMFVISSYRNELYDKALNGWRVVEFPDFADGGQRRFECLYISPNIPEREPQLF